MLILQAPCFYIVNNQLFAIQIDLVLNDKRTLYWDTIMGDRLPDTIKT